MFTTHWQHVLKHCYTSLHLTTLYVGEVNVKTQTVNVIIENTYYKSAEILFSKFHAELGDTTLQS